VEGLVHLACDGVMPAWLAREYGVPLRSAHRRVVHLPPTARSRRAVRLEVVGWSREEAGLGPRALRHALATAVARYRLGARPDLWDSLAVRSSRRSVRGREWAQRMGRRGELAGVPRPDAEVWDVEALTRVLPMVRSAWGDLPYLHAPVAVEVDAVRLPLERIVARWEAWEGVYSGVLWVALSEARARTVQALMSEWLADRPGLRPWWAVWSLGRWWDGEG